MAVEVDTRISPALHPLNVTEIEGYGEDVASVLAPTERAFAMAYAGVASVFNAREAARNDPTLNEAAQVIKTDDLARTVQPKLTREFDSVRGHLEQGIAHIETQLSAPVTAKAAHSVASEIRSYVRNLSTGERLAFVRAAIQSGDDVSASAVLGAPSYLSGLDADMQRTLTRMFHERTAPDMAKRLKVMSAAKDLIEAHAGKVFLALAAATGHVEVKNAEGLVVQRLFPKELRDKKAQSDRAFAVQSA